MVSSDSVRTSQRTQSQLECLVNCFFGFSSYLTEKTVSVGKFSQLFLRLQLVPHSTLSPLEGPMSQMYVHCSSCTVPWFLSDFNRNWTLMTGFRMTEPRWSYTKIRAVEDEFLRAGRRTDRRYFVNAPVY